MLKFIKVLQQGKPPVGLVKPHIGLWKDSLCGFECYLLPTIRVAAYCFELFSKPKNFNPVDCLRWGRQFF